jgi:uncharacterized Ntn-hydrolase superfamily protein
MIASQAVARPGLGFEAGDLLVGGTPFEALEAALSRADPHLAWRQIGIVEKNGPSFVHTGAEASDWKGHVALPDGLAVGNGLAGAGVVAAMARAFAADPGEPLAERLLRALEGGAAAGGQADASGRHKLELSAVVRVFDRAADPFVYGGGGRSAVLDLRIDYDPDAVGRLRGLWEDCRPLRAAYELRARDPAAYARQSSGWEAAMHDRAEEPRSG